MPADVTQPDVLKRFLNRLIEELDIVLGFRGDKLYATDAALTNATDAAVITLDTITADVAANEEAIAEFTDSLEGLTSAVSTNEQAISDLDTVLSSTVLSSTYHNFDNAAYATLEGNNEFNTLGSNITNAPYTPVGVETYYNFINSVVTANGGVVQTLRVYSTTTLAPTTYFRIGNTFAEAVSLGWT